MLAANSGAPPSWQSAGLSSFRISIQTITSSGTYTPTAGMIYCIIEVVGGGGGGGGCGNAASSQVSGGSGGGGGGYAKGSFSAATIGVSQSVTIGAAGVAGAVGAGAGGNGGTTSVGAGPSFELQEEQEELLLLQLHPLLLQVDQADAGSGGNFNTTGQPRGTFYGFSGEAV